VDRLVAVGHGIWIDETGRLSRFHTVVLLVRLQALIFNTTILL
jgi:hypothetical protein